jgi:hypothetical protein
VNYCLILVTDKLLDNFSQQQGVWRYCVWFLQHCQSQHVLMYSLNLLEVSGEGEQGGVSCGSCSTVRI